MDDGLRGSGTFENVYVHKEIPMDFSQILLGI